MDYNYSLGCHNYYHLKNQIKVNKKVVILGAGESGTGAALLAKTKGYHVFVSDSAQIKEKFKTELDKMQVEWEEGSHTWDKVLSADLIIKSPGIPDTAPIIEASTTKAIPVISEIEFAGRFSDAKMICITGSNGKTTTTSLLYHIFKQAGKNVGVAGNIGASLARQVATAEHDYYIVELSSFQLDNMYDFKADIAILLNITPDHLDRYEYKMDNYIDAKFRIIQNQTPKDHFIYWVDDAIINKQVEQREIIAQCNPFSLEYASYTTADQTNIKVNNGSFIVKREHLKLLGTHNLLNAMAATTAAQLSGLTVEQIEQGMESFEGVEHRLEYVTTIDQITYINDSKATNVDSCYYALQAMHKPTVLILGGKDKGNNYDEISQLVKDKCVGLVFMGIDNSKLQSYFKDFGIPISDTCSIEDAVKAAKILAPKDSIVLLSPCCASFDLFSSYENRGELFKQTINKL